MRVYPKSGVHICAPNELELASMFNAAKEMGLFENKWWFEIIDAINVDSMFLNSTSSLHTLQTKSRILNSKQKSI